MSRIIHRNQSQTPCAGRDEALLMYLHGALPPMARIRTARHIHRCATCQQRVAALTATSQALADTVRGDTLPQWTPPTLSSAPIWLAGGAAVFLLATASFFTVSLWTQNVQAHTASPAAIASPGITDEQCQNAEMLEQQYRFYKEKAAQSALSASKAHHIPTAAKTALPPTPATAARSPVLTAESSCLKEDDSSPLAESR